MLKKFLFFWSVFILAAVVYHSGVLALGALEHPEYQKTCESCHNGKTAPKLGLISPTWEKAKEGTKKIYNCTKEGDQGCLEATTDFFGGILGGTGKFFRDTLNKAEQKMEE